MFMVHQVGSMPYRDCASKPWSDYVEQWLTNHVSTGRLAYQLGAGLPHTSPYSVRILQPQGNVRLWIYAVFR
jgi:hypothetical protein